MGVVVSYGALGTMTVYFCRAVEPIEVGREDIVPIGRRVEDELSDDEELLLRNVCLVLVVNSDEPVSCDVFLLCSSFFRASSGSPSHLLLTLGT